MPYSSNSHSSSSNISYASPITSRSQGEGKLEGSSRSYWGFRSSQMGNWALASRTRSGVEGVSELW
jgi:hypothetical protein